MFDLFITFFKIGAFTFGGGYVMLPLMEEYCVDKKKWLSHDEFMNTVVVAESTPGPIAINLATYCGYKLNGLKGALIATTGVVLPSLIVIYVISLFFDNFLKNKYVSFAFCGIRIAVSLIIIQAGIRLFKKELEHNATHKIRNIIIFSIVFLVMMFSSVYNLGITFIQVIIASMILGIILWFT